MSTKKKSAPTLPDRFELLGDLGQGGMGEVFRVRDKVTEKEVIRFLLPLEDVLG